MPEGWLALRLAGRELRAGLAGFRVFVACIALGVAAIAATGSTAQAFRAGLASQARLIVGGDVSATIEGRRFTPAERSAFARLGRVSDAVAVRVMGEAADGRRRLVELRGVSAAWPLAGKVELAGGVSLAQALSPAGGVAGAAVERPLMDHLGLKVGDRFLVGQTPLVVRAVLLSEPDRLGRGFMLAPTVLTSLAVVEKGGFLGAGIPFGETARIELGAGRSLGAARRELALALNHGPLGGGYRLRDRNDAAPGIRRLIDQLEYFLGFVGLASLVAGGLGVFGAVNAHMRASEAAIALMKVFGAKASLIRDIHLIRIGVMALLGVGLGLAVGAAIPPALGALVHDSLPVPALFAVYPWPLAKAAAFGLLSAAAFSLIPLARVRSTAPSVLLRGEAAGAPSLGPEAVGAGLAVLGLGALAMATAPTPLAAAIMIAGVAAAFLALWALGGAAAWAAGRLRGGARGRLRIALANLAGPHSAARISAPAIGLGVALVSAVVLVQSALQRQIDDIAPRTAPSLVFTEIPAARAPAFDAAVARAFGRPLTGGDYLRAPFATGRIIKVRGALIDRRRIDRADRWAYDNDISLSAIGAAPANAGVVAGRWWSAGYRGPPLAALSEDAAAGASVKVGDIIGIAVLGREIDARVAALRRIDYAGFGANFPLVLDPAALEGADLTNIAIARATAAEEARVTGALGGDFPQVNVISVREQLAAAGELLARLTLAVRAVASVAVIAALLALIGAVAAGARQRATQAAILKVLGAGGGQILAVQAIEFALVGALAGAAGIALGAAAAWPVASEVFRASWSLDWRQIAALFALTTALTLTGGLIACAPALLSRPAPVLRAE